MLKKIFETKWSDTVKTTDFKTWFGNNCQGKQRKPCSSKKLIYNLLKHIDKYDKIPVLNETNLQNLKLPTELITLFNSIVGGEQLGGSDLTICNTIPPAAEQPRKLFLLFINKILNNQKWIRGKAPEITKTELITDNTISFVVNDDQNFKNNW